MKFGINNPAWLQAAGNLTQKEMDYFSISSNSFNDLQFSNGVLLTMDGIEYSMDKKNWEQLPNTLGLSEGTTVFLRNKKKIDFQKELYPETYKLITGSSAPYSIGGDLINLIYPSGNIPTRGFYKMFYESEVMISESGLTLDCNLSTYCFESMFDGAMWVLPSRVNLPAETLQTGCYKRMFASVEANESPLLPARELVDECYAEMFAGSLINRITCLATVLNAVESATQGWITSQPDEGFFIVQFGMESAWPVDTYFGCPDGWSIYPYEG